MSLDSRRPFLVVEVRSLFILLFFVRCKALASVPLGVNGSEKRSSGLEMGTCVKFEINYLFRSLIATFAATRK